MKRNKSKFFMTTAFFAVFIMILSINSVFSQKIKVVEIYNKGLGVNNHLLYTNLYLDDKNNIISRELILAGQDNRFSRIEAKLIIYKGTAKEMYNFINKIEKFYNENETDVYESIEGCRIRRAKYGIGILDKENKGEVGYDIKSWRKIKKVLIEWSKENNEPIE